MKKDNTMDTNMCNEDYEIKEQDRFLPIANVARVMKLALPPQAKLSKESKQCVQECVSEFISFVTSQAVDKCTLEKRKTLNGEDILWAMFTLGFEHYAETLKIYLAKYRHYEQVDAERRLSTRKRHLRTKRLYDSESDSEAMSAENFEFDESPEAPYVNFEGFDFANSG